MGINRSELLEKVEKKVDAAIIEVFGKKDFEKIVHDRFDRLIGDRYSYRDKSGLEKLVDQALKGKVKELVENHMKALWDDTLQMDAEGILRKGIEDNLQEMMTRIMHSVLRIHYSEF